MPGGRHLAAVAEDAVPEEPSPEGPSQAATPEPHHSPEHTGSALAELAAPAEEEGGEGHEAVMAVVGGSQGGFVGGEGVLGEVLASKEPVGVEISGEEPKFSQGEDVVGLGLPKGESMPAEPQEPARLAEPQIAAGLKELNAPPVASAAEDAEADAMEEFLSAERRVAEAPPTPVPAGLLVSGAGEPLAAQTEPTAEPPAVVTQHTVAASQLPVSPQAKIPAAAEAENEGEDNCSEEFNDQVAQTLHSAANEGDLPAEPVIAIALLPAKPALETVPAQAEELTSSIVSEEILRAVSDAGKGSSGSEVESTEGEASSEEECTEEEESSKEEVPQEGSQSSCKEESSSDEESPVRPQTQAPRFPTRLLDDYAAIITPVRNLTQQARAAEQLARAHQQVGIQSFASMAVRYLEKGVDYSLKNVMHCSDFHSQFMLV